MKTKKEKTNFVTRRVVVSRTYDIYQPNDEGLIKIGSEEIPARVGRINEKEIANKYGVPKIVTVETAINKKLYGVPIDRFMDIAIDITDQQANTN